MFANKVGGWVKKGEKYAYVVYEWSLNEVKKPVPIVQNAE